MCSSDLADFSSSVVTYGVFVKANLTQAIFAKSSLQYANLSGTALRGADFTGTAMKGLLATSVSGKPKALPAKWSVTGGSLRGPDSR